MYIFFVYVYPNKHSLKSFLLSSLVRVGIVLLVVMIPFDWLFIGSDFRDKINRLMWGRFLDEVSFMLLKESLKMHAVYYG